MRRVLLLLLLAILPLQFMSAAAAAYCRHESDVSAKHVGHHEHEHEHASKASDDNSTPAKSGLGDPDCEYCHLSCAQPLVTAHGSFDEPSSRPSSWFEPLRFGSRSPDALDRPNWSRAV